MQVVIITKEREYIGAFRCPSEFFFDREIKDWAANYVIDNNDEMIDIDYHEGGSVTHNEEHQLIHISGDNGIITFYYNIITI
jgi:hypothetical protein